MKSFSVENCGVGGYVTGKTSAAYLACRTLFSVTQKLQSFATAISGTGGIGGGCVVNCERDTIRYIGLPKYPQTENATRPLIESFAKKGGS